MQLPDTSEWLCIETGLLRSQFASLAVDQLAASIVSILSSHSCPHDSTYTNTLHHFEVNKNLDSKCCSPFSSCRCFSQDRADIKGIPPQVLKELSEMCIPILHFPKALNVVRVLKHYGFSAININISFHDHRLKLCCSAEQRLLH